MSANETTIEKNSLDVTEPDYVSFLPIIKMVLVMRLFKVCPYKFSTEL